MSDSFPFQSVVLDLSDPRDVGALLVALMNRESELRREEQTDPAARAVDVDGFALTSDELRDEAGRLARLRASIEAQLGKVETNG